ncbi:hypothetical protein Anas_07062 [Armadillidium nasatum]|uniref:Uncharacterized protein n=1 Tax=Armadillidium nasatum TaxID=96803 RepID=A0A5N5SQB9_9CRUS|nr:hypothetical protein Anas_07062 [Armadillidium nasatum]
MFSPLKLKFLPKVEAQQLFNATDKGFRPQLSDGLRRTQVKFYHFHL